MTPAATIRLGPATEADILIDPLATNTEAHRFYQRLGFEPIMLRLFNETNTCLIHKLTRQAWAATQKPITKEIHP